MKDINKMTRKEFMDVPYRDDWKEPVYCHSLVIIPMPTKHDSGYRHIRAVACDEKNHPICTVITHSDAINFEGIGGGRFHKCGVRDTILPSGFSMDCLPVSGLFRIWCTTGRLVCGMSLSSFELNSSINYDAECPK